MSSCAHMSSNLKLVSRLELDWTPVGVPHFMGSILTLQTGYSVHPLPPPPNPQPPLKYCLQDWICMGKQFTVRKKLIAGINMCRVGCVYYCMFNFFHEKK